MTTIGWIGLGKMGLPICKRLRAAGFRVVAFARSAETEAEAAAHGFDVARTIAQTAHGADVVVSAISDDSALLDIVLRPDGLASCLTPAQIYVDTSTVSPVASARVADALTARGCAYLRAPVSGSTATAAQGALTAIVSGPAAAFEATGGVFAAFSKKAFLVGAGEEARYLKLAINAMVGATSALLAEALRLSRAGGLDDAAAMEVVTQSAVGSPLLGYKSAAVAAGDYTAAFSVTQMLKDFDLIANAAEAAACETPLIAGVRALYRQAVADGLGAQDFFVLTARRPVD